MDYTTAFSQVDQLLTQWQPLIHFRPFHDTSIPEELSSEQRQLAAVFKNLDEQQLHALEHRSEQLLETIEHSAPIFAKQLEQLQNFENDLTQVSNENEAIKVDRFFNVGIPGRKWQQIQNFAYAMPAITNPIIDWCSGKGHLARLLHHRHQQPVTCLEYDAQLCRDGESLAQQLPIDFVEHDVLQPLPATLNTVDAHYTALHACGDLHLAFLKNAVQTPISGLSLSPCCYQKTQREHYQPLSRRAQASSLHLSRQDLALAVAETVTGGARVVRLRHQERLWRVAFDIHQKQLSGETRTLQLPSFPKRLLSQTFTEFCQWAIEIKELELPLPQSGDEHSLLQEAEHKLLTIRQLELLQQPLKRPLELWLVLDRMLYLEEHGFECQLNLFCDRATSPRNFLIQAQAHQSSEAR